MYRILRNLYLLWQMRLPGFNLRYKELLSPRVISVLQFRFDKKERVYSDAYVRFTLDPYVEGECVCANDTKQF